MIRTRFAPSPTGYLHIGGLRTALWNFLYAKKHGGEFIVRIEDTDQKRFVHDAEKYFQDALEWAGIIPDVSPWHQRKHFGPMRQSERSYARPIELLIGGLHAYHAFDTDEELQAARDKVEHFSYNRQTRTKYGLRNSFTLSDDEEFQLLEDKVPHVIRFDTPENQEVTFTDGVFGDVTVNSNTIDDKVLVKKNGIPTYHLASVVDDHNMGITHVIRGSEWLISTPLHILLYEALGVDPPEFVHVPLMLGKDGKKFSKRDGDAFVFDYRDKGYFPDAFMNYISLVGWSPGGDQEIMSMDEMAEAFDISGIGRAGGKFDVAKCDHFNSVYLHKMDNKDIIPHFSGGELFDNYSQEQLELIADMAKKRSTFLSELNAVGNMFFKPVTSYEDSSKFTDDYKKVMTDFVDRLKVSYVEDGKDTIKDFIYKRCEDNEVKMGKIMPGLRNALTGGAPGPDLLETIIALGFDRTIERVKATI